MKRLCEGLAHHIQNRVGSRGTVDRLGMPIQTPKKAKGPLLYWPMCLKMMVGREWIEHSTYGLKKD
jgi:hypothetical protein